MSRLFPSVVFVLALAAALTGPLFAQGSSNLTIKLGGIFDLTSDAGRLWGTAERNGFLLAIKDFESAHPAVKVEYTIENSAYSNTASVSAFQKLTSLQGAKFIVGPTWEMFVATMPLCERNRIICMAPSNNSREFDSPKLRYSFTAYFRENGYSDVIAEELNKSAFKNVAVFATVSPYADPLVDNLAAKLERRPSAIHRVLPDHQDFRSLIARTNKETDALVVFLLNSGQLYSFLRQWVESKRVRIPVFTDDSPLFDAQLEEIRALSLDIRFSQQYFPPLVKNRWEAKYLSEYGNTPEAPSASVAYDETMLLLTCVRKDPATPAVRDCIASTTNYPGLSGTVSFGGRQVAQDRKFELRALALEP
jgi:ABC-type branched-subunit amino acid transport system substrate-binding protein